MYKLNPIAAHNAPLHKLLDNGYKFALLSKDGKPLKYSHYEYQLDIVKKCNRGSKVKLIKDLLK